MPQKNKRLAISGAYAWTENTYAREFKGACTIVGLLYHTRLISKKLISKNSFRLSKVGALYPSDRLT